VRPEAILSMAKRRQSFRTKDWDSGEREGRMDLIFLRMGEWRREGFFAVSASLSSG